MKKKITILTEPVGIKSKSKLLAKKILGRQTKYGGHYAVTRSLIEGLQKIGYTDFNYRPKNEQEIAEHVHVLAGVDTLRYAIELKKKGIIRKLTAGPNIVVFSTDYDSLIADEAVDLYLQPSQWAADLHMKLEPKMKGRCVAWPAGVDLEKISIRKSQKKDDQVLIYQKSESDQFCYHISYLLKKHGYCPVLVKYGEYQLKDYIRLLEESAFCIVLSRVESQGLFLAEAWAMDVPTICFDPHYYMWKYDRIMHEEGEIVSGCPYLTEQTGLTFRDIRELESILGKMPELLHDFSPRKWVLENMTDEVCASRFLEIVN